MFAPKSVLLTGANRGIGLELVKRLLNLEAPPKYIFATCRNPSSAEELNNLAKQNASLLVIPLEVTDESSIENARSFVASKVGDDGLTLLINNAGVNFHNNFDVNKGAMMQVYEVNTVAPLQISKVFHALLKKAADRRSDLEISCSRAAIINVSSLAGSISTNIRTVNYPYRASKAALNMVTKVYSDKELPGAGILCVALHPGWIKTDMGTEEVPLTIEQGGQCILNALHQMKEEHMGMLYSAEKLEVIPW